jgi:hypothetical protein
MPSTICDPAALRARFDRFVCLLVRDEKLALTPNATVEHLDAAFEAGSPTMT